ncbi:MAG: DoxX family protein [Parachlamydiaceae bacterium]|nr:DoxX family protein [Parachlamydiaceae bacterium]
MLLGRLCICTLFISAGIGKFLEPEPTAQYMAIKGMPLIPFFLYSAAILEVLGGVLLFFGLMTRWAVLGLALFLIPATLIFHNFWSAPPGEAEIELIMFFKNLAIFGGLLYIAATGAGKISLDYLFGIDTCKEITTQDVRPENKDRI